MENNKILVFDFDGTIADTIDFYSDVINKLAYEFNFKKIKPDEIQILKNKTSLQLIKYLNVPIVKLPIIMTKAHQYLNENIDEIKPVKGVAEVLKMLHESGVRIGILTSNSFENVKAFLKQHNIDFFDFISSSSKILGKRKKLNSLVKKLNVSKESIIYIGDETRDIEAAKKAGIKNVAVTWGYNSKKLLLEYEPDFLIENPLDILKL
ncbi:MAG: HAD-IIIA family hydrolase [Desulfobacterales bacterium]|nr:HAD-IIIA family hydrolase [Desulfobacterales bacterium]